MTLSFEKLSIGFVGAGRMAQALGAGIASMPLDSSDSPSGKNFAPQIGFFDPNSEAATYFQGKVPQAKRYTSNQELAAHSSVIILAVKPQMMSRVLEDLRDSVHSEHLLVSVAAGVPISVFQSALSTQKIIRVMPNTPALIGEGASAYCGSDGVSEAESQLVAKLLATVGQAVAIEESQMDAITGLSGSGPAYVYTFIEAMVAGAAEVGLPKSLALPLATQTVLGAAQLLSATKSEPDTLRAEVTSPGGTTLAGLQALQDNNFSDAVVAAIRAATHRAKGLGELAAAANQLDTSTGGKAES